MEKIMNGMPMLVTGLAWVVAVRTVMFCLDPYRKSISCSSWPSVGNQQKWDTFVKERDELLTDYRIVFFDVNLGIAFRARHQFVVPDSFFVDSERDLAFGAFQHC